jgi:hypothetical protein
MVKKPEDDGKDAERIQGTAKDIKIYYNVNGQDAILSQ